jgi:CubicO group peptidase (beta-lactamase class C family)
MFKKTLARRSSLAYGVDLNIVQVESGEDDMLADFVDTTVRELEIPGVAVGVWHSGRESVACHGVTSLDNPLPVDRDTLFLLGSITKTYTATALLRLAEQGRIDLDEPVRRYVPGLKLADEPAAERITVMNLLNHTAGLGWDLILDTGAGDDALARFVDRLSELELVAAPGQRASYSQAGYSLLGRVIEAVTGKPYENAVGELVFQPLGLSNSFFALEHVITRRFAVGHNAGDDGNLAVGRMWRGPRYRNAGAGLAASVSDVLRWARFHLSDGDGVLSRSALDRMTKPTAELHGSALGDALGICWFLRDIDGVAAVGHGGSANGQFAELLLVPERDFAIVSLTNAGPNGIAFNQSVLRWATEHYLGLAERDPQPAPFDPARVREVAGSYDIDVMTLTIATDGSRLTLAVGIKPEIRAGSDKELPPDYPPAEIGFLPGDGDEYLLVEGGMKGQRGFFTRDDRGAVTGIDLAGRLFTRIGSAR